jgi:archaellum component FlaC
MAMERSRWTDERLDDLAGGIGNRFDQVDKRFDQVDNRFAQVDKRFDRVDREFDRVHQDIRELRQWIFRLTIGMSVGFISVLSAILVRGA